MAHAVLMLVDALRYDQLGCLAGRDLGTPNIDRLAAEGVVFTGAVAQGPSTRPSVGSYMTGLYPSQHNLIEKWRLSDQHLAVDALASEMRTMGQVLSAGGVETAAFVGGNVNLKPMFGLTRGFSHLDWRDSRDGAAVVDDFERWLSKPHSDSTFCYLHFMDVHSPFQLGTIPDRLTRGVDLAAATHGVEWFLECYAAAVRQVDGYLGRVMELLQSAGVAEEALVIVTSDHGEEHGEHGAVLCHGRHLYREVLHVPLIIRLPGRRRAGTQVEGPVELLDLVPTLAEHAGLAATGAERSLLPLARGETTAPRRYAFSQLLQRTTYVQSVTTATRQFIETYTLEEVATSRVADLTPGVAVRFKGQYQGGGTLLATAAALLNDGSLPTVIGPVEAVDPEAGTLTIMGATMAVDGACRMTAGAGEVAPTGGGTAASVLAHYQPGMAVSARLEAVNGWLRATRLRRKPPGGKAKVNGTIESVRELEDGLRVIRLAGVEVLVWPDVPVAGQKECLGVTERQSKADMAARVLEGDFVAKSCELFDLASDPAQAHNLIDDRPDVAQELEGVLAGWVAGLESGRTPAAGAVDVDPETLEQLRLMGYLE